MSRCTVSGWSWPPSGQYTLEKNAAQNPDRNLQDGGLWRRQVPTASQAIQAAAFGGAPHLWGQGLVIYGYNKNFHLCKEFKYNFYHSCSYFIHQLSCGNLNVSVTLCWIYSFNPNHISLHYFCIPMLTHHMHLLYQSFPLCVSVTVVLRSTSTFLEDDTASYGLTSYNYDKLYACLPFIVPFFCQKILYLI